MGADRALVACPAAPAREVDRFRAVSEAFLDLAGEVEAEARRMAVGEVAWSVNLAADLGSRVRWRVREILGLLEEP